MAKAPALVKTKPAPKMKKPTKPATNKKTKPAKLVTPKTKEAKKGVVANAPSVVELLKTQRERYLDEEREEWELYYARRVRWLKHRK